jgi:hypothetical protein
MRANQPYQPFLLRILHGVTGIILIAAMVTAYWTYDTFDGRWLKLPLPEYREIESIHGTFGLYTLIIFPIFAIYAFRRGNKRLIQSDSLNKLIQLGKPIWWYSLHRLVNTLALFALTFALYSGRMMDSEWLPRGELNHFWYYAHLISWLIMAVCIMFHLLMSVKVGGVPLLLSMVKLSFREQDSPKLWLYQVRQWGENLYLADIGKWWQFLGLYKVLEIIVLLAIMAAWIIPLFSYS